MSAPAADDGSGDADAPAGTSPLSTVLDRLGSELTALHRQSEAIQDVVARLMQPGPSDPTAVREMQALDSLTQHLHALATFVDGLAAAVPPGGRVDPAPALASIRLGLLRSRLSGAASPGHIGHDVVEFF